MFQANFDFRIALDRPYKLCDFRPAYGEMFQEYLKDYDFWGHCDIDLMWGNLRKFFTDGILNSYDRIYSAGHCSLYRNTPDVNSWYRTLNSGEYQNWHDVFASDKSFAFDEWAGHCGGGMSFIIQANGKKFYTEREVADINPEKHVDFVVTSRQELKAKKNVYFLWECGSLYACSGGKKLCEVPYLHWHNNRKIFIDDMPKLWEANKFFFIPPGIATCDEQKASVSHIRLNKILFAIYFAPKIVVIIVKRLFPKRLKKIIKSLIGRE